MSDGARDFELSDLGNADRMIDQHQGNLLHCAKRDDWFLWAGCRYQVDEDGGIVRMAAETLRTVKRAALADADPDRADKLWNHAHKSENVNRLKGMVELASKLAAVNVSPAALDPDPWLFNCANCTIETRNGKPREHRREDRITKVSPVLYSPTAAAPTWVRFLDRIMGGDADMIGYLQRIAGQCLTGDISVQELYIPHGPGANGKSVFCDTIVAILGDYGGIAPETLLTAQTHAPHPTEIADLCGKRAVVASETEEGAQLRVQQVKRLTGDSTLKGRFMGRDFFEFPRTHKTILQTNNRPVIREASNAIWRRIRLIPFNVIIPTEDQDPNLLEKLRREWPGILRWMVDGCIAWQRDGMEAPAAVKAATASYQSDQDPLSDYLADRCVRGREQMKVSRGDLHTDYLSWCTDVGDKFPMDRNALFEHVRKVAGVTEGSWRQVGIQSPVRGFRGIGLAAVGAEV